MSYITYSSHRCVDIWYHPGWVCFLFCGCSRFILIFCHKYHLRFHHHFHLYFLLHLLFICHLLFLFHFWTFCVFLMFFPLQFRLIFWHWFYSGIDFIFILNTSFTYNYFTIVRFVFFSFYSSCASVVIVVFIFGISKRYFTRKNDITVL